MFPNHEYVWNWCSVCKSLSPVLIDIKYSKTLQNAFHAILVLTHCVQKMKKYNWYKCKWVWLLQWGRVLCKFEWALQQTCREGRRQCRSFSTELVRSDGGWFSSKKTIKPFCPRLTWTDKTATEILFFGVVHKRILCVTWWLLWLTVSSVQMEWTWVPNMTAVKIRKRRPSKERRMRRMTVDGGEKLLHSGEGGRAQRENRLSCKRTTLKRKKNLQVC